MRGPSLPISQELHAMKYRGANESFEDAMTRIADALKDDVAHFHAFRDALMDMRFLPAGRVQSAIGSPRQVTPYNCYVMDTIGDDYDDIMRVFTEAGKTMRMGGGVGYDFSTLRPHGAPIKSMDTQASGPMSFATIPNAICQTIASAGHRRGAQMLSLRVDHPDVERFIRAKQDGTSLTNFNLSVSITDEFMQALLTGSKFDLRFEGQRHSTVDAKALWNEIMRATWDWAEPGVLFIDTINRLNNLRYCETIATTNPCAEQPLPPYGACLLGSFNLVKYVHWQNGAWVFDMGQFAADIPHVIRAMDNIIDQAIYPLPQQEREAKMKRRMGIGVTGLANAMEALGYVYGSEKGIRWTEYLLTILQEGAYQASAKLAAEKGAFPLYIADKYLAAPFIQGLDMETQDLIRRYGIRNSHLLSIAPTGTISLTADNVSSGLEPVFSYRYNRTMSGKVETVEDYGVRVFGVRGKTATQCSADDHVNMLLAASRHVDSAVSKTCNVDPTMAWDDFKNIYVKAWQGGARGCTTYNPSGKRAGILVAEEGAACFVDPETGAKSCG